MEKYICIFLQAIFYVYLLYKLESNTTFRIVKKYNADCQLKIYCNNVK